MHRINNNEMATTTLGTHN